MNHSVCHYRDYRIYLNGCAINSAINKYKLMKTKNVEYHYFLFYFSPYWVKSFDETFSQFKHMGLWEYCFDQFRYPYYQFDHLFDGCHHVFSEEYYVIREWLLPPWLMTVQSFMTIAFLLTFFAQVVMAFQLVRFPLNFILQREYILSFMCFVCVTTTGKI